MKINQEPPQEFIKSILDYNPEIGIFIWKKRYDIQNFSNEKSLKIWNSKHTGKEAGNANKKSIVIYINYKPYRAHRLAWIYVYGDVLNDKIQIDHENCNPFQNNIKNLREATHGQNCSNTRGWSGRDLPKGVYRQKNGTYISIIQVDKKRYNLGTRSNPEEAHALYVDAAKKYNGKFARAA